MISIVKRSVIITTILCITAIGGVSGAIIPKTHSEKNALSNSLHAIEIDNNNFQELQNFKTDSAIVSEVVIGYSDDVKKDLDIKKTNKVISAIEEFKKTHVVQDKMAFPLPLKYRNNISSYTGYREEISAIDTGGIEISGHLHTGIDYACPDKTPVYAAKDGYVTTVYPGYYNGAKWKGDKVYGGLIIIHHFDGTSTLYGHLSLTDVREGTYVNKGDKIGLSGGVKGRRASGASTGPHLHFSIFPDIEDQFDYDWKKVEDEEA